MLQNLLVSWETFTLVSFILLTLLGGYVYGKCLFMLIDMSLDYINVYSLSTFISIVVYSVYIITLSHQVVCIFVNTIMY